MSFRPLSEKLLEARKNIFENILTHIDLQAAKQVDKKVLVEEINRFISKYASNNDIDITEEEKSIISQDIVNDMIGLGPLEYLFNEKGISDILINGPNEVYIEHKGKVYKTTLKFRDNKHLFQIAQRIASQANRQINESNPILDARLKNGDRVNIIVPPVALDGVTISIRKYAPVSLTLDDMVEYGSITPKVKNFLSIVAKCRLNILISGGPGSGKTTLMNAILQCADKKDRIITIEDAAELHLENPHVVRLESRPPNLENRGEITIRDLLKSTLRMRPDRLVVGECRGAEAFDMLQAMNTGNDGTMSTLHANTAGEALSRLENMVLMAGYPLPNAVVRHYIANAINLVIHVSRMRDGTRRITQIIDITGATDAAVKSQTLLSFEFEGLSSNRKVIGHYKPCSQKTSFDHKAKYYEFEDALREALS